MKRIIGRFEKQAWSELLNDAELFLGAESFDCTHHIIFGELSWIHSLDDCEETTDAIGRRYVSHDGPFAVYVTESICEFFGVRDLEEITEEMLSDARKEWQGLPKRTLRAVIVRVSYAQVDHDVDARSESEARDIALDRAGNIGFSGPEHHTDYQVTAIKEIQDERDLLEA